MLVEFRNFLFLSIALGLAGCSAFDGEELRGYLPRIHETAPILFAKRVWFKCAIAEFSLSSSYEISNGDLPQGFEKWAELPVGSHVVEDSIVYRILDSQSQCWKAELIQSTGHSNISDFLENLDGGFSNRGSVLLIFDRQRSRMFVMDG